MSETSEQHSQPVGPGQPAENERPTTPRPKRRKWRRFWRISLTLLLLAAIFHRPLLETGIRLALIKVAARYNLRLDLHFSGSFFTNLTIRNVQALPTGKGKTPVEKIAIESVHMEYSIPMLIRHGIGEFLRSYEIRNADLVFVAEPSKTKEESEQKKSLADDLNTILAQPALYADQVRIENFNITVRSADDATEVKGIHLFLHPYNPGYLRIARIHAPGLPVWENLSAETSYVKRNLNIRGLALSPDMIIDDLNFDASQRADNKGSLAVKGHFFGGTAAVLVQGSQLNKKGKNLQNSYDTTLRLEAAGIDVHAAAASFHADSVPPVKLAWLTASFKGEPESPKTWNGQIGVRAEDLSIAKVTIDSVEAELEVSNGLARLSSVLVSFGKNFFLAGGEALLPESVNEFAQTSGKATFQLRASDLPPLLAAFVPGQSVGGELVADGDVSMDKRVATGKLHLTAAKLQSGPTSAASIDVHVTGSKKLPPGESPLLEALNVQASGSLGGLKYQTFTIDSANVDATLADRQLIVQKLAVARGENGFSLKGSYLLPGSGDDPLKSPMTFEFSLQVPKLDEFGLGTEGMTLQGQLEGSGAGHSGPSGPEGNVQLSGSDFRFGGFKAQALHVKASVAGQEALVDELRLQVDSKSQVAVTGKASLEKPMSYEGAALVLLPDLSIFHPVLNAFGMHDPIAGSVDLTLEAKGAAEPLEGSGQLKLSIDRARYGKLELTQARVTALFAPQYASTSELRLVSGATSFQGGLEWKDNRLRLHDIDLRQGTQQALSGYVSVPFEPQNKEEGPAPLNRRVAANINVTRLDVAKLLSSFGQHSPVESILTANLVAGGTLLSPFATFKLGVRGIKSPALKALDPAEVDVIANYAEKELTIDATARQRDIQPLTIKGKFPVDVEALVKKKSLDPTLPLDVTVRLPQTSLAFVPKLVPTVRTLSGTAGLDAHVGGTVGAPLLNGAAVAKIDYARMKSEGVPTIGTLQVNLPFTQNSINVQRLHGELGGGTFDLSGKVEFPKITEPKIDLRLRSNSVLVMRNDSVTVRVDTDVTAAGAQTGGKVSGSVFVTQSRFFRDIDILPVALPGRPKPQPLSAPSEGPTLSLPPMLANWIFDVNIKTRANDPFQIRGNLANGSAMVDMKFAGSGKQPALTGLVHVQNFIASLPFSKLKVTRGFITFTADAPLVPKLDISAESTLRDYHIIAYIYGSAKDPQLSLTSEPPLPQQDIISLLATGATSSELTGNSDVLASRAAVLVFEQLYHKVFKQRASGENLPLADRFSVDAGAVDNRSGRNEVSASFKLTNELFLVGDVDVTGQFAGRLRYLIRFR